MTFIQRTSQIRSKARLDAASGIDNSKEYQKAYTDDRGVRQRSERIVYQMAHALASK